MKTVAELLRDADPLRDEPRWSATQRCSARQAVLDTGQDIDQAASRALAVVSIAACLVIAVAIMSVQGSRSAVDVLAAVRFEVRLAEETPTLGLRETVASISGQRLYLHQEVVVTNSDISGADVVQGDTPSTFGVSVTFNTQGAAKMLRATQSHVGRPMAILLDGEVVLAPVVRSRISTSAVITGNYTKAEAERIAAGIRSR
jgi:hypothetical protein